MQIYINNGTRNTGAGRQQVLAVARLEFIAGVFQNYAIKTTQQAKDCTQSPQSASMKYRQFGKSIVASFSCFWGGPCIPGVVLPGVVLPGVVPYMYSCSCNFLGWLRTFKNTRKSRSRYLYLSSAIIVIPKFHCIGVYYFLFLYVFTYFIYAVVYASDR